jgi:hypothetical protein
MLLKEFTALVPNFGALSQPEKVLHFGWYIHVHQDRQRFDQATIRACYEELYMDVPNLSLLFMRLIARRPKVMLQDGTGYYLESGMRQRLDEKYGLHETTIALSRLLKELPGKISDEAEKLFLSEAITCYHNKAFRAAIVMTWNLAYDHLLHWILKDPARLARFNANIVARIGARRGAGVVMAKREEFEELKEAEVLDICGNANLFASNNTKKVLDIQLTKRNMAAHPSLVIIDGPAADDTISSLVNNVVLVLK